MVSQAPVQWQGGPEPVTNSAEGFHGGWRAMLHTNDESAPVAGLVKETQVMQQEEPRGGDSIGPLDWLKAIPFEPAAWSDRLGWVGLEAVCCRTEPAFELDQPALTHHWLPLFVRPPPPFALRSTGPRPHRPPPPAPAP